MKINIVTVNSQWILQKMAERIASTKGTGAEFTVSHSPMTLVDANFYIDVYNCYRGKTDTLDIGHFTHVHANDVNYTSPHWLTLDHVFHYGRRYYDFWHDQLGYPKEKMTIVPPGEFPPMWKPRKPKIGIFQRGGHEGKGFEFMKLFAEWYERVADFGWLFVGNDWEEVVGKLQSKGAAAVQVKDSEITDYYSQYDQLYELIDYLLIPSLWEGGPMCFVEAAGKGIPVISADVGFVSDFNYSKYPPGDSPARLYLFKPGDIGELVSIMGYILEPLDKASAFFKKQFNWENYANILVKTVERLKNES